MHGGESRPGAWGGREEGAYWKDLNMSDLFSGAVHLGLQGGEQVCRAPEGAGGGGGGRQVEATDDGVAGNQWQNATSQLKIKAV